MIGLGKAAGNAPQGLRAVVSSHRGGLVAEGGLLLRR